MNKIRIGIVGYGNLGKGVELAIRSNQDTELAFVATRRDPSQVKIKTQNIPGSINTTTLLLIKMKQMLLSCAEALLPIFHSRLQNLQNSLTLLTASTLMLESLNTSQTLILLPKMPVMLQ